MLCARDVAPLRCFRAAEQQHDECATAAGEGEPEARTPEDPRFKEPAAQRFDVTKLIGSKQSDRRSGAQPNVSIGPVEPTSERWAAQNHTGWVHEDKCTP